MNSRWHVQMRRMSPIDGACGEILDWITVSVMGPPKDSEWEAIMINSVLFVCLSLWNDSYYFPNSDKQTHTQSVPYNSIHHRCLLTVRFLGFLKSFVPTRQWQLRGLSEAGKQTHACLSVHPSARLPAWLDREVSSQVTGFRSAICLVCWFESGCCLVCARVRPNVYARSNLCACLCAMCVCVHMSSRLSFS